MESIETEIQCSGFSGIRPCNRRKTTKAMMGALVLIASKPRGQIKLVELRKSTNIRTRNALDEADLTCHYLIDLRCPNKRTTNAYVRITNWGLMLVDAYKQGKAAKKALRGRDSS